MSIVFVGYKCGMTSFFTPEGVMHPVTIIKVYSNYLVDVKSFDNNISLVKISACSVEKKKVSRPIIGFYSKLGIECLKYMFEFKTSSENISSYSIGDILPLSFFDVSDRVDVIGTSKGRGFSGVIKRHNFKSQGASHGNSLSHRVPGSIGQCQTPGRVFKGKKMPGRYGNTRVTVKNLSILNIYNDLGVIMLKGSIPGFSGSRVFIKKNF